MKIVDQELLRLDMIDGKANQSIHFNTEAQDVRGREVYFARIGRIRKNINAFWPLAESNAFYQELAKTLQGMNASNVRFLSYFDQYFHMVELLSQRAGTQKDLEYLKNHVAMALDGLNYFMKRPYAREYLIYAAGKRPYDVLTKYLDFNRETWFLEVLEAVAKNDPNAVKQYFGSIHPVNNVLKTSKDPVVMKMYEIYKQYGSGTVSYTNIDLVSSGKLTIEQSYRLTTNKTKWYRALCELRRNPAPLGNYSLDDELSDQSLQHIRRINMLHEEKDEVRFASLDGYNAEEIYNLMVYSRDEIFTSTFLGCYKRLYAKRQDSSFYVFFSKLGFNRFRTFVQMCAGYNTLQQVLNTMGPDEQSKLLTEIVRDLETTGGNLAPAVEVADIYGSILDPKIKAQMAEKLRLELAFNNQEGNDYGTRLYGLLYKLAGYDPATVIGNRILFNVPELVSVDALSMFPDGKNIQQHIFYDDDDGEAAYNLFLSLYKADPNYSVADKGDYTLVESVKGKKICLFLNKPKIEGSAEAVRKVFESQNRYADLVVHRGHSYHLSSTVDMLTNNVKVAILGSCGGYHNITRVLDNATDAQIVSSKQIGTWTVNNVLIREMNEQLRTGAGDLNWQKLWLVLDKKLETNEKWRDYIPPYQNLGMKFVKAFETI